MEVKNNFVYKFTMFICFILWRIVTRSSASVEKSALNLMDLPKEMLAHVASFVSSNELKNFGLVNKKCNEIRQHIVNTRLIECVDLRKFFYLNEEKFLERVKDLQYKRVNLNQCYYLSPHFITALISRESVRGLDLTEYKCTQEVIEAVVKLNLTSLGISLSKNWEKFFVLNQNKSVSVLNGLEKLKISHRFRSRLLMSHVARFVLPHCHQLKKLTLFTHFSDVTVEEESEEVFLNPKFIPTPVPNLEIVVLDFYNNDDLTQQIKFFLDLILNENKIPLTMVDLGYQTVTAVLNGILRHHNISFENADVLYLDSNSVSNALHPNLNELDVPSVINSMPKSTKYERIYLNYFRIPHCSLFTEALTKAGSTTVKRISLRGCEFVDGICYFIDTISNLSSGVTFLNITLARWSQTLAQNIQLSNSDLMKSIANLTNLRTLCIVPAMLSHKTNKDEKMIKLSLYEVAKKCKFLRKLQIADNDNTEFISQDVLSCIKFFKNLRELYLINFGTFGTKHSVLPEILEHCSQLKHLHIDEVINETRLEEMLPHAKQITHLYLEQDDFQITKTFVDNLSQCTQLEKLHISICPDEDLEMLKYFAKNLKKLNKLQFLSITESNVLFDDYILSVYNEIKELRPRFFFENFEPRSLPMAHRQFLEK